MKSTSIAMVVAALIVSPAAFAADDASALAKSSGCLNCHAMDATKKVGSGFKTIAEKYKGQAGAEATLVAKLSEAKGHPATKTSKEDLTKLVKWVLAQ